VSTIRYAINPLQWLATPDGWLDFNAGPPYPQLLEEIKEAGFDAINLPVSTPATPGIDEAKDEYRAALEAAGVQPAPGYLSGPLHDPAEREGVLARAVSLARAHAEFGVTEMFVACGMRPDAPRVAHPARGHDPDPARLEQIAITLEQVGEATLKEGVTSCFHQHVGTWVEVEDEVEFVLDRVPAEVLALGPDSGHLAWAGIDPVALVHRHADRVKSIHLKDARVSVADRLRGDDNAGYRDVVAAGLWVEPGRGELDLDGFLHALPEDFDGWAVVEVDAPDLPTPQESARASAEWITRAPAA
jgi:inosose dehydratase